jgi:crotonobetainyl-CoA:carnitine CoA-transferase CaiB-like acyl-CoA transferase
LKLAQFSGLKVLELASVLAGPGVGQFFAELGADVIKVENLKTNGDVTRSWKSAGEKTDDRSAYFCSVNWGKKSLAIDLTSSEGKEVVQSLARKSEIVIASYKPGDAEKLEVDYKTLSRNNPGLIYGQITGYGSDNPRVGYDAIIQAEAGFMYMNGDPGGASLKMPVALMDILAGHQLKEALLLAMLEKAATGKGKLVEISLIQSAIASLANQASNWLVANKLPEKQGSKHPNIAPYGEVFSTSDGQEIILAIGSDQQFRSLCAALSLGSLATDSQYISNEKRVENREALYQRLNSAIGQYSAGEILSRFHQLNIPAGIIQNMKQVLELPEARSLMFDGDGLKGLKSFVGSPSDRKASHFLPPPHFGEHTVSILQNFLNYSPEKVNSLRKRGIII